MIIIRGGITTRKFTIIGLMLVTFILLTTPVHAKAEIKIIINKSINKLAYIKNGEVVKIFPVATGRTPALTPEGKFKVVRKLVNPYYTKLKIPGGSPRNPLGVRWLGLNALGTSGGTYGIHGTNNPKSIGKYASSGCIRMYNQDVIWLYNNTSLQTPVEIINGPWDLEIKPVKINLKGQLLEQTPALMAYLDENRVMVPCRFVAEAMGCKVSWNGRTQEITFVKGKVICTVKVGETSLLVSESNPDINDSNPVVQVRRQTMEVPVFVKEGTAFMHIRPLAEALGFKVAWEAKDRIVFLSE